ncbi:hypothetical protein JCGZ_13131 [Jatropha curcas]|uniref:Uncharacterized protein n=1 Tax=Jatropha curcas TaxID=180498 RepID=A0A067K8L6_JATCU|nr:uncharacterized protein LOC105639108 [Jatropha curcas]KDP32581.1 hypothetical protein JCGZ_13131 [Jatropha curcas]
MEETRQLDSKKRKRSFSPHNPFKGIFTRSKSQIYLHRHRSGRSRTDSFRYCKHHTELRSHSAGFQSQSRNRKVRRKSLTQNSADDTNEWSSKSIKDLRARRVFSLASVANASGLCLDSKEKNVSEKKSGEFEDGFSSDSMNLEEMSSGCFINEEDIDRKCLDSKKEEENDLPMTEEDIRSNGYCKISNEICDFNEEYAQETPPGANLQKREGHQYISDQKIGNNSGLESVCANLDSKKEEINLPMVEDDVKNDGDGKISNETGDFNEEYIQATPPDAEIFNLQKGGLQDINDQKIENNAGPKSGPNPWSRVKVFKTPGSLSYRRLLPYLKDAVQDNSCADSNSMSIERNFDSQKDPRVCSPTSLVDEDCSTPPVDEVNEKIKTRDCENLETLNPDSSTREEKPLNGSSNRNNCYFNGKRKDSNSKSKMCINPCSRLKIFKTGSSFSYRRLLPYLIDIAKDNSVDTGNEHYPKFEKSLEERPLSKLSMSEIDETPLEKLNGKSHHMEHDATSLTPQLDISTAVKHASCSNQQNLMTADLNCETPVSKDSQAEQKLPVVDIISNHKDGQSDSSLPIMSLVRGSSTVTMPLSVDNEEDSKTLVAKPANGAEPFDAGSLFQASSKLEETNPMGILAQDLKKGILKKYRRGCRGLCTCLNCASFRLHAERAFEFSKNQMQDAEEVALELINELTDLRNTLEKATVGSNDHLIICINQVKKACKKATEAEELAKTRLCQMNYDLNIHCKITCGVRPRVRFSNNVEERIITKVNSEQCSKILR